jgi:hypothetical protein
MGLKVKVFKVKNYISWGPLMNMKLIYIYIYIYWRNFFINVVGTTIKNI